MLPLYRRLETLERQLTTYVRSWARKPPARTPALAQRRRTYRRWVLGKNLRQQRCVRLRGTLSGWSRLVLTPDEQQRIETLIQEGTIA
jgi:squalene cyclase